jgi:hypothetical protein
MLTTRRILAVVLVLSASCAKPSTTGTASTGGAVAATKAKKNPYVISTEELRDPMIQSLNVARAIQQLRPTFFRTSGPQSFSDSNSGSVQVSHDFGPLEPVSRLGNYDTLSLVEIRYLNANEAQTRFGVNANGGPVIVLLSNKVP